MAGKLLEMRIGELDVLVETRPVAGTEPTGALDKAQDKVVDAFARAKTTIVAIGESTLDVIDRLAASRHARPTSFEVEFGVGFSTKGNVIVAEASADATLKVKLVYGVSGN